MERWHQFEEIFQGTLQRDPAERDAFVREACHGDAEIQREVLSLLAHHDEAGNAELLGRSRATDRRRRLARTRPTAGPL